jgi:DNA polymerase III epsilon subunit-like protein|tara:strand:+ start:354 stop:992 length:639 start_codon:yes stop_codon:yes gene_type:complete
MRDNLLRHKKSQKYLFFDYETCHLNLGSKTNKPWQLAFTLIHNGETYKSYNYWLKWENINVSKDAARITGFTDKEYKKRAVDPKGALDEFESYLYNKDYLAVGHNVLGFDVYIHGIHRRLLGLPSDYSYIDRLVDTNCLAKAIEKQIPPPSSDFTPWQYKLCNFRERGLKTNLKFLCQKYDIDFDPGCLHDALYDIERNYEVFKKQVWEIEI